MYNCPKCDYGTNVPVEFRNHLKEQHPDIENPDLAYLHAGKARKLPARVAVKRVSLDSAQYITVTYPNVFACVADACSEAHKTEHSGLLPLSWETVFAVTFSEE